MPMPLKKIMKISTPRQVIDEGEYPAMIVGVMYPKDASGDSIRTRAQFLLQVHGPHGMFYVSTSQFSVSFNETGTLFELLSEFAGASNGDDLLNNLDYMGYIGADTFDEADFIGTPVTAVVAIRELPNPKTGVLKTCNVVKAFKPISDDRAPALDKNHMIPAGFANVHKYDLVFDEDLYIDCI